MRPSALRAFGALADEAVGDAVRRRIVPVVAGVSLLSLLVVDSCTSCGATQVVRDGATVDPSEVAGWTGMVIYAVLALWTLVLAGILGSDHLAETLEDGSANLALARPVSRDLFALARLAGALAIAFATGAILLGVTAALLRVRQQLPIDGALAGAAAAAGGAAVMASFSMAASLVLPRMATALLVLAGVGSIAFVNALAATGAQLGAVGFAIDRWGPPLLSALLVALSGWIAPVQLALDPVGIALRLALWIVAGVALLVAAFRRRELGR